MKTYAIFNEDFFNNKPCWMPNKLYRVVCQRSNPRSKAYMMNLLTEKFPEAELIDFNTLPTSGEVIFLWPDAIGIGWRKIEKQIFKSSLKIRVLNGRQREFFWDQGQYRLILMKRFFEITFFPELVFAPIFLFYGFLIAAKDKLMDFKK